MSQDLAGFAEQTCGSKPTAVTPFAGGDISGASLIEFADGLKVVGKTGPVVAVEARMLEAMGLSAAPVPDIIGFDERHLLIEHLPSDGMLAGNAWVSLARALDGLHSERGEAFGWQEDYALGHVTVQNDKTGNWPTFWGEARLLCHVPHISRDLGRRIEKLVEKLPDLLPAMPKTALLHGDLWGGNVLVSGGRISGLIDPCACYGDREVDVSSLTVFDTPTPEFFDALDLESGWRNRLPVYRLWMWLLHVRLFGESYRSAVERELATLGF